MYDSDGSPHEADARLRHVYVGRECPCQGDEECEACEGTGDVGELITLAEFRAMVRVRLRDRPSLIG